MKTVHGILWKQLTESDIQTMSGRMRAGVQHGGGQPDIRLRQSQVPDERILQFVENSTHAQIVNTSPLQVFINQNPLPEMPFSTVTDQLEIKHYGPSRPNETSIMRQHQGYTNPRWTGAANGQPGDYIYILRLGDGTFTSGWAPASLIQTFPDMLRDPLITRRQGVEIFTGSSGIVGTILSELRTHHNVLLYGPPGTGKTYLMQELQQSFLQPPPAELLHDEQFNAFSVNNTHLIEPSRLQRATRWVTFHQTYSYEDFIGGRRPEPAPGMLLNLVPFPGVLMELATIATQSDGVGLLLIDEINRGNVSRIFGEFVTLMEPDKRLRPDGSIDPVHTLTVRLSYTGQGFQMPYHIYTLATMNSVDRSIMPLDAALRRRFHIIELHTDYVALGRLFGLDSIGDPTGLDVPNPMISVSDYGKLAVRLLYQINTFIRAVVGPDFEAGHGFFWGMQKAISQGDVSLVAASLVETWSHRLLPHLQELFRAQPDLLAAVLRADDSGAPADYPYRKEQLPTAITSIGGISRVKTPPLSLSGNIESVLRFIARVS